MKKDTTAAQAVEHLAKPLRTLHPAAGGRRAAAQPNGRCDRTGADWRGLIGVVVSAALSLGVAGAAWAVLPDELKPVTNPQPRATASSKPVVGSEPKPPAKSRSEGGDAAGDQFGNESRRRCPRLQRLSGDGGHSGRPILMGSPKEAAGRIHAEGPQHPVTVAAKYALGKHEVSVAELTPLLLQLH